MGEPVLEIEDLCVSFLTRAGEIPAVTDFSCAIGPGESMGLVGESGCGKSTVALAIMNYLGASGRATGGAIRFRGRDVLAMPEAELARIRGSEISMVYQEPMASLNPALRIGRQLAEVPMLHEGLSRADAERRAAEMLDAVRLPDPGRIMRSWPHQLSGGQQQRIVIAMALLSRPSLLLLDEPTTALDVTVEAGIVRLVRDLGRELGTSLLFISHNLGLVLETCDRITVMYAGEAVETGRVGDVFSAMRHPYTRGLFRSIPLPGTDKLERPLVAIAGQLPLPQERPRGCNFGPRCGEFEAGTCDGADIAMRPAGAGGHESRCLRIADIDWDAEPEAGEVRDAVEPGPPILEVEGLRKYYDVPAGLLGGTAGTVRANESITLAAREAETLALVGESGCGKSTLARVLLGLETASGGTAIFDGRDIAGLGIDERGPETVGSLQMVFQNPFDTLNPSQSVGRQIVRALEKFGFGATPGQREARMLELLDLVKLPRAFAGRMPRQLSGGQKQRIGIARAFAGAPRLVVADEPVSALDVSVQAAITGLLMDIQRTSRTAMLFISHDLGVVRYLADRVVVMYLGHVVEQGTTDQVFAPPYHPYTEALLSAVPVADPKVERKRILLDGDLPSAMAPPPGCPFQTRCPRRAQAPDGLCEREAPPVRRLPDGHELKCHLDDAVLAGMEPVIQVGEAA